MKLILAIIMWIQVVESRSRLANREEVNGEYWFAEAQKTLQNALKIQKNQNIAKNIIFFLGDGMGVSTVTAARIFKGQSEGHPGEESMLEFERFPYVSLVKTYNVDRQVPDSAGTSTAYLCGVKGNYETVGVDASAIHNDCNSVFKAKVTSIVSWAQDAGKDTGFITTTRVTHASPAGLYAHTANRYWEVDSKMPQNASSCKDIALQLIEDLPGNQIKVILGGGRGYFTPQESTDPLTGTKGLRADKRNLIEEWIQHKKSKGLTQAYLIDKENFDNWDVDSTDYVLGLFDYDHLAYDSDRPANQPSLKEMTAKAIRSLRRSSRGYFLFIEGGRIDHAHHKLLVRHSLEETVAFDEAVKAAVDMTDESDTLIIVTADHSHVMTINGYPNRGHPILGFAGTSDVDQMLYTTLMYTNGPGISTTTVGRANLSNMDPGFGGTSDGPGIQTSTLLRANLSNIDPSAKDFIPQATVPLIEETHGGEDVVLYARGPMAHLFHGVQEQNYIPHVMSYAACIGKNLDHCEKNFTSPFTLASSHNHGFNLSVPNMMLCIINVLIMILSTVCDIL